tara:strand:- start:457 stop:588 length:132 start_codon:yes stop_codon:yes gene_type:complete
MPNKKAKLRKQERKRKNIEIKKYKREIKRRRKDGKSNTNGKRH